MRRPGAIGAAIPAAPGAVVPALGGARGVVILTVLGAVRPAFRSAVGSALRGVVGAVVGAVSPARISGRAGRAPREAAVFDRALAADLLKPFLDVLLRPSAPSPAGSVRFAPGGVSAPESVSGAVLGRAKFPVRACLDAVRAKDRGRLSLAVRALLLLAVIFAGYGAPSRVYGFVRQAPWLAAGAALGLAVVLVLVEHF